MIQSGLTHDDEMTVLRQYGLFPLDYHEYKEERYSSSAFIRYILDKHKDQKDKYVNSGYYRHLAEVSSLVMAYSFNFNRNWRLQRIQKLAYEIAWGHDVLEDIPFPLTTYHEISDRFSPVLAQGILWLSDIQLGNRRVRKQITLERMKTAQVELCIIKACDIQSNMRTIVRHDHKFAPTYIQETSHLLEHMSTNLPSEVYLDTLLVLQHAQGMLDERLLQDHLKSRDVFNSK